MKKNQDQPAGAAPRRRAEERLKRQRPAGGGQRTESETARLVHELEVHQIELKTQNEELQQARAQVDALLVQYTDLYDFAPAGYMTLDRDGTIRQMNLTGARLLGVERSRLVNRRFGLLVAEGDRRGFKEFLQNVFASRAKAGCEVTLPQEGSQPLVLRIEGTRSADGQECRTVVLDITERIRYRSLFQNMLNGFAYCRMQYDDHARPVDFVYLDVNEAFERLTGLTNVVGKPVSEVIPGIREVSPELFEAYDRVASTGISETFEFDFKSQRQWLTISVYSSEKGHFVAVFDDITARKRAEEVLRESEGRYRAVTESANDAIVTVDSAVNIVGWNPGAERIFGYTEAEINGQPLTLLIPHGYREGHLAGLRRVQSGGEARVIGKIVELEGRRKDTSEFPLELSLAKWESPKGWFVTGTMRDITERKRASEDYQMVLRTAMDGFWAVDMQGRFLEANETYCRIIGYTRDELLAMRISDIEVAESPEATAAHIAVVMRTGSDRFVTRHRRKDGRVLDVEVSANYLPSNGGRFFVFARDVTERKRAESQRERLAALVEASSDFIGFADPKTTQIQYINKYGRRMCGIGDDEDIGTLKISDVHPAWMNKVLAEVALPAALRDGV